MPVFEAKSEQLLSLCADQGVVMRPFCRVRDPYQQAALWRQSRSKHEIDRAITTFDRSGAPYLAHVLNHVGSQHGKRVTNALPGYSWHQWDEAIDCFWLVDDHAEWSTSLLVNGVNGYQVYAQMARKLGLRTGADFKTPDPVHVQFRQDEVPAVFSMMDINDAMELKFG